MVDNLYLAPNTITQQIGLHNASGVATLDVNKYEEGDVAGFRAFKQVQLSCRLPWEKWKKMFDHV